MLILQPFLELFTDYINRSKRVEYMENTSTRDVTDASLPALWYPYARLMAPRKFIFHMGPTNSGKTKHAIESLERAQNGIYCAPLRLLAWETAEKLR